MQTETEPRLRSIVDFNSEKIQRYNRIRHAKDRMASVAVAVGGVGVIAAILLIFLYLLYEVMPMFTPVSVHQDTSYIIPGDKSETLYLAIEEQNSLALRVSRSGEVSFFHVEDGALQSQHQLLLPANTHITSFSVNSDESRLMVAGLSNGQALVFKHNYRITYPNDQRLITPRIDYPYGVDAFSIIQSEDAIQSIAIRDGEESLIIVAHNGTTISGVDFVKEEDFLTEEMVLVAQQMQLPSLPTSNEKVLGKLLIDVDQRFAFLRQGSKQLGVINLKQSTYQHITTDADIQAVQFLLGGISLLIAEKNGTIGQWFMVRDEQGQSALKQIRSFESAYQGEAVFINAEQRRKGFVVSNGGGDIAIYHSTAHKNVFNEKLLENTTPKNMSLSPRANRLLVLDDAQQVHVFSIDNEHPEVSWSSLWQEVWYESYDEPQYIWQSSASSNDFEPKMSLMPLSFGTLKAAFYAMLLGAPLAVCGAIYTAYFMTPMMRRKVKPLIELMEALPTVILGFLAGLWLAPFLEANLVGIFSLLLFMPPGILIFAFLMSRLPQHIQNVINEGWHSIILIPVVIVIAAICLGLGPLVENSFFHGDMRQWLSHDIGISFDQRNALVVGIAMGFSVIPTIFSIAEDAIFSVPKHLSFGSLALGATPWQTLVGVVLPTASPGIFSGLMIGLGRAVGETMIVLMATGNTPIMDANIFEGMRTLSANIAVEVPEAEVGSSHYRVLFLAAFVLFIFTFVVNTAAEIVRQRLREKYGSL